MFDYSGWLRRAENFVRGLTYLPGEWGISVACEPPLDATAVHQIREVLPLGLPAPLFDLYKAGAANYRSTYHWSPNQLYLPMVEQVFPHQYSLYGGARFIPAGELQ